MRTSRAKLLIALAILIIALVELRSILGRFGIVIEFTTVLVIGGVAIVSLLAWAFLPVRTRD